MAACSLQCTSFDFQSVTITGSSWVPQIAENVHKLHVCILVGKSESKHILSCL